MPDPHIRKWTLRQVDHDAPNWVDGPCVELAHPVRVVEAAPVIAALVAITEEIDLEWVAGLPPEKVVSNAVGALAELRRAVSDGG